ncbi:NAD(P)H-hydrate dehydratase [Lysobacter humi (ex Lee et al. 2017)]
MHADSALFDADSVRRLEIEARRRLGDDDVLMERAGQAAWRALLEGWPAAQRIAVVCGAGGNGGDGYVLARHALAAGRDVGVWAIRSPAHAASVRAEARYRAAGGRIDAGLPGDADVVVDAVLGIGLDGPLRDGARAAIEAIARHPAPVLALDVPSGLREAGPVDAVVHADRTIEFLLPKHGLRTGRALEACGRLVLDTLDTAVDRAALDPVPRAFRLVERDLLRWLRPRRADTHKGESGRVLCVGGDAGIGGALLLCAEAAVRAGAGLVRAHTRAAHATALLVRLPEALHSDPDATPDWHWPDAVALGPGLGRGAWGRALLAGTLASGRPTVLDADALNLLAEAPRPVPQAILTPHPAEAGRLLGRSTADVQGDRFGALAALVERYGAPVVLKGAGTLVGAPGRVPHVVSAGNPGLATGGTGDVLTGTIASLLAQGLAPADAAVAGALLHAAAGDAAAVEGERGLRAADLLPALRRMANPR